MELDGQRPAGPSVPLAPRRVVAGWRRRGRAVFLQQHAATTFFVARASLQEGGLLDALEGAHGVEPSRAFRTEDVLEPVPRRAARRRRPRAIEHVAIQPVRGLTPLLRMAHLRGEALAILPIERRLGAKRASSSRVVVGRAPNSDVLLRVESVSKFHAWFDEVDDGTLRLTDADSRNGTRSGGVRLAPRVPVPVRVGEEVAFGDVVGRLLSSLAVWSLIDPR